MDSGSLIDYYASLLILQYLQQPKAVATIETLVAPVVIVQLANTVQTLTFSGTPASGAFTLVYGLATSASIAWNASNATIEAAIAAIIGSLIVVSVTRSLATGSLQILFNNVDGISLLTIGSNTLETASSVPITISVSGNADLGPLALQVQNAYNLIGDSPAVGVQLDVLGKYAGVTRYGNDFSGPVVLDDTDFLTLIKMVIVQNNSGSSLYDIQVLLNTFFPGSFLIFDYADMHMDYWFNSSIGSATLAEFFVEQNRLPKPMGVQLGATIYVPNVHRVFGFRTYTAPAVNSTPFNSYTAYDTDTHWLSYKDGVV